MKEGRPAVFLNGCNGGAARGSVAAMFGDFSRSLIAYGARSVIAPFVRVDSKAAARAAKTFYETCETLSVVEAVRHIRELALDSSTTDEQRSTFVSYAVFARPGLKLVRQASGA
jgi:CHAT domain-containing protein